MAYPLQPIALHLLWRLLLYKTCLVQSLVLLIEGLGKEGGGILVTFL